MRWWWGGSGWGQVPASGIDIVVCSHTVAIVPSRHTCVALQITERLLSESEQHHLQLIDDSYLDMLHMMLDSTHSKIRIIASMSVSGLQCL